MYKKIEISHRTIIFAVSFVLGLWLLFLVREIILLFFVALLLMAILNPTVTKITKGKISRGLAVVISYIFLLCILGLIIGIVIPPLVDQTASFAIGLPRYLESLGVAKYMSDQFLSNLLLQLGSVPTQVLKISMLIFSNVLAILTVLILAFYLLLARNKFDGQLEGLVGPERKENLMKILTQIESELGGWARGELVLMFIMGVISFVGLTILDIPYALPLAVLAGLFEIVPNIGPIISAAPAVIIGFSISPLTGFAVIALNVLAHQLENYLFVPKVMEKSAGVSPIITLLALAVGVQLAGIVGVLISVPVYIILRVLTKAYLALK